MEASGDLRGELGAVAVAGWARAGPGRSSRPGLPGVVPQGTRCQPPAGSHASAPWVVWRKGNRAAGDACVLGEA